MAHPVLLVAGIGSRMGLSLQLIRDMGFSPVVVTDSPDEVVTSIADRVVHAYPRDAAAVGAAVLEAGLTEVAGVLSLGYENPPVVSLLAEQFGTPTIPYETALDATNKERRIALLEAAGVCVPRHVAVGDIDEAVAAFVELNTPVAVVKPVDLTSSLGVAQLRQSDPEERTRELISGALRISPSHRLLIEEYLDGTEHTVEGVIDHGRIHVTGISDRNYSDKLRFAPYFFENGDTLPSALGETCLHELVDECVRAATALNLDPAVFSCDVLRTHGGRVVVLEVAARMAGSRFGTEIVPLSTGVNVLPSAVRIAIGDKVSDVEVTPRSAHPVVLRYLAHRGGRVLHVGELPDAANLHVYDLFWERRPQVGELLLLPSSGKDMIAGVIATAGSVEHAEQLANAALAAVPLTIYPTGLEDEST